MHVDRGRNLEDIAVADIEELENLDASENHARNLNAKAVFTPHRGEDLIFPIAEVTAKLSRRDLELREPALRREQPVRSEDLRGGLQGNSETSQSTDETKDDAEARNDFWSTDGDFVYRHHNARVQLLVSKEESFPTSL